MFILCIILIVLFWVVFLSSTRARDLPYEPHDYSLYDHDNHEE